jgi:hypothetical protein
MPKYHSIETIPAKTFFEILNTKNYQLLKPKPSEKDLEEVFIGIYDEFFLKSDNFEAKRYLEVTKEIAFLNYKISSLKQSLHFYHYNQVTKEMRDDFINALFDGFGIVINKEVPFIEEVKRILEVEVGILKNDLSFLQAEFENMIKTSKKQAFDYEENIVSMEGVVGRHINDGIMLDKYIAYSKQVKKIISKQEEIKRKK